MAENLTNSRPHGQFLEAAGQIGAQLCRDAIWQEGRCNWLGDAMEFTGGAWSVVHRSFGPDLYSGSTGIAFFLGHLYRLTQEPMFLRTMHGALRQAWSRREGVNSQVRGSLYSGWVGMAYACSQLGQLLEDEDLTKMGLGLALGQLKSELPEDSFDVISGRAGAIAGLLELHKQHHRDEFLNLARHHADVLIRTAQKTDEGWSWHSSLMPARADLTGFSHGAAGVGWALLEVNRSLKDQAYHRGGVEAFRYERKWFDARQENWRDLRIFDPALGPAPGDDLCSLAWCHGAPGISLSRLRAYELSHDVSYLKEAEAGLRATGKFLRAVEQGQGSFCLCHGQSGNAEALLLAADVLDPVYRSYCERAGLAGIERYLHKRLPWPCGVPNGGETPGLMLGLAGIGYFYLRLYDSARNPSILLVSSRTGQLTCCSSSGVSQPGTANKRKAGARSKRDLLPA
jgi:lantibiotic modifying enzyme